MPEELFDIIDDNDNVIGQAARSDVHRSGLLHRGVHLLLFDREGRLLIQKRSADRKQYASLWDCSVSEHVKAGESYLEAAMRGAKEELGVDGIALEQVVKFKLNYGPNDNEVSMVFKGRANPDAAHFDPGEIESIQWFSMHNLKTAMESHRLKFCGWFVEIMNWLWDRPSALTVLQSWRHSVD